MSLAQIKPRSNVIPVRVQLERETPATEYCRTVRRHWLDTVKLMEAAPFGSDDREILAYIAEEAEQLYRDAQFVEANEMEEIMAYRIRCERLPGRGREDEIRRLGIDAMRRHAYCAKNANGPDAGRTVERCRSGYYATYNFANQLIGDKSQGMMREVPFVD